MRVKKTTIWGRVEHTWTKLSGQDSVLNLVRQLDHGIDFLASLLSLLVQLFKLCVHGVLAAEESVNFVLFDWETGLDRLFAGPVFSVCLPLHENLAR